MGPAGAAHATLRPTARPAPESENWMNFSTSRESPSPTPDPRPTSPTPPTRRRTPPLARSPALLLHHAAVNPQTRPPAAAPVSDPPGTPYLAASGATDGLVILAHGAPGIIGGDGAGHRNRVAMIRVKS
jgi:hypothetical protein